MVHRVAQSEPPEGGYCGRMPIKPVTSTGYSFRVTVVGSWRSLLWLVPLWWLAGDTRYLEGSWSTLKGKGRVDTHPFTNGLIISLDTLTTKLTTCLPPEDYLL